MILDPNPSVNWSDYPNFKPEEFICHVTGENKMQAAFLDNLQLLRDFYGKPMVISSGYRGLEHPIEKAKTHAGEHTLGLAADILVNGENALELIQKAINCGFNRIGVNQKGDYKKRFIHLGLGAKYGLFPVAIWSY